MYNKTKKKFGDWVSFVTMNQYHHQEGRIINTHQRTFKSVDFLLQFLNGTLSEFSTGFSLIKENMSISLM